MRRATPEVKIQTLLEVSQHIIEFLRDVGVRVYLSGITEPDGTASAFTTLTLTDEATERLNVGLLLGGVPLTELEKTLPFDPKPPAHFGELEIALADNPHWPEFEDSYPMPIVLLILMEPQMAGEFTECVIWRGADDTGELDSAVRRLLKTVEEYYAELAGE